jgi:4-hydroxy-3-methylbut-2-enyl diphosphate reductase
VKVYLSNPRGFCAGVDRAIEIVERAIELYGAPIYVRHEVVHNRFVVDNLRAKGAVFIEDLGEVPDNATLIFSAHGVSKAVEEEAARRGFRVFDATCPLVTKVHMEVARLRKQGTEVILIGHAGHPEVEGTMGQANDGIYLVETAADIAGLRVQDPGNLAYVTQTTLSVDDTAKIIEALRSRFPAVRAPKKDDICYATQNRQDAVKKLASECDVVLVIGSRNSSNSNRLREVAEVQGARAYMIDGADDIRREWLEGVQRVGITAGASAPEVLVQQVLGLLQDWGATQVDWTSDVSENVVFPVPKPLRRTG